MAKPVKCVLIFRDSTGTGWTETHYRLSSASDSPPLDLYLANLVDVIAQARRLILGSDCQVIGARVSYKRVGAIASIGKKFFFVGDGQQSSVNASTSLAVQFADTTKTRTKITHVRGFWDSAEVNGEYHPENPPAAGFSDRLDDWKQALIGAGYGWMGTGVGSSKGNVTNYATSPSGHITFTLLPITGPIPAVGEIITLKFARINSSRSPLNTQLRVEVLTANTVRTIEPIAAGPFVDVGTYIFRALDFIGYNQVYNVGIGRRQQGRPIGQLPGRSKARARY